MNTLNFRRTAVAVATAAVLPLALTACSSGDSSKDSAAGSTPARPRRRAPRPTTP